MPYSQSETVIKSYAVIVRLDWTIQKSVKNMDSPIKSGNDELCKS